MKSLSRILLSTRARSLYGVLLSSVLAIGCSGAEAPSEDARVDSQTGTYRALALTDPDPPRVGSNALHLELEDAYGEPVVGAVLDVSAWMPAHGHGAATEPLVAESGEGAYEIEPLDYPMPGRWEVTIAIVDGDTTDQLLLEVEVR